ncbi:lissencephaly-1 homolog [Dysidea avara]|uniref:lissencephaly-1 homolog n=1 Tax=Dysidea avara TaxID=196820 RepID=UPI00332E7287
MEKRFIIRDIKSKPITALLYHALRREIITGYEDGALKSWEADSGHNITVLPSTHKGWITQLVFWNEGKVMFSSSVDGTIILWVPNGTPYSTLETRHLLLVCHSCHVRKRRLSMDMMILSNVSFL